MKDFVRKMSPRKNIDTESWFIECYRRYRGHPMRILISLYKGNYHKFALAVVSFFIKHACVWVLPILTANIINDVTSGNPATVRNIIFYTVFEGALIVINVPMNYLYTAYKSLATRYVETGLRKALVRKLQQLSISYHVETQSGRLQSKIMRDVEAVETLSTQMFLNILNIVLNIGVALIVTGSKSKTVLVFFVFAAPIAAVTMVSFRNVMKNKNREFRKEMEETSARVMEMVELVPVTRAHALEDEEVQKISSQLFAVAEKGYQLDVVQALFGSVGWAIFQIFQVIYQSYFSTVVNQVSAIVTLLPIITKGVESVNSIGEVLLSEDVEHNEGKDALSDVNGVFEFRDVGFCYNNSGSRVLDHLNLCVEQGQTIALVGESGAGKSTILNMVIGFHMAGEGQVLLDGHDMRRIDLRSYRKHLAVVPQTSILFSGTIRENITYGCGHVTDAKLAEVVRAANLTDLVESLPGGLDTAVGEHGGKLSGGQRQRIAIARAFIRDPKIIVLDEATSALDSISEKMIQEAINNLVKGRTTFIVAHRLSTIRDADRIAVIADGRCVEFGTFEELMALRGAFYRMKVLQS